MSTHTLYQLALVLFALSFLCQFIFPHVRGAFFVYLGTHAMWLLVAALFVMTVIMGMRLGLG